MESLLGQQLKNIQEYVQNNLKIKSKEDIREEQKILAPPEQLVQQFNYRFSSTFKAYLALHSGLILLSVPIRP